jgi:hypothetical protein
MVTKKVTSNQKAVDTPTPATKSFPTAALGASMVILTNYQAEIKQFLGLILKGLT